MNVYRIYILMIDLFSFTPLLMINKKGENNLCLCMFMCLMHVDAYMFMYIHCIFIVYLFMHELRKELL